MFHLPTGMMICEERSDEAVSDTVKLESSRLYGKQYLHLRLIPQATPVFTCLLERTEIPRQTNLRLALQKICRFIRRNVRPSQKTPRPINARNNFLPPASSNRFT